MRICQNCGQTITGNFCSDCGQKRGIKRLELNNLVKDIPHALFHVDGGFLFNLKNLVISPGRTIRRYLAGSRKPYFHPITFLAVLLVFNYFAVKVTNLHYYDKRELLSMSAKDAAFIKEYDATQWWFLEHTYLYMLIAIPVCTVFYYFFFRLFKHKFNMAESAVILMFIIAEGVFIQSVIYLLTGWVRNGPFIRTVELVNLTLLWGYAAYAMYRVINPVKNKAGVVIACIVGGLIVLALMLGSAYLLLYIS
jgi:hypothetical protein